MSIRAEKPKSHLWLRGETKRGERRTPLTPIDAARLVARGVQVSVESSALRIYSDEAYERAGCEITPFGSWRRAPRDAWILGLKELTEDTDPLHHRHIYFAHAYKGQAGAGELLERFQRGEGKLYDLEYIVDQNGRRVAAFGFWAGFVGAALGVAAWAAQQRNDLLGEVKPWDGQKKLIESLIASLPRSQRPKAMVVGALGRCGRGAIECLRAVGIEPTGWDLAETRKGGPFPEILEHDIFVNCVLLQGDMPPFLNKEMIAAANGSRRLSVISDVSCDANNPSNPIPIYRETTRFEEPARRLVQGPTGTLPIDLIAIDHLPSLLPRESSDDFAAQLIPHLESLLIEKEVPGPWARAEQVFRSQPVLAKQA